jgi:hypothetical protein
MHTHATNIVAHKLIKNNKGCRVDQELCVDDPVAVTTLSHPELDLVEHLEEEGKSVRKISQVEGYLRRIVCRVRMGSSVSRIRRLIRLWEG